MKRLNNILFAVFLLFFAVNGRAQGDVVVHTDPRLSLLLKKNHPAIASSHPAIASSARVTSHKAPLTAMSVHEAVSTHPSEVLNGPHAGEMSVNNSVKPPVLPAVKAAAPIVWAPRHNVRTIYTGKGFRVQIYNGTDRSKAMEIKNEFARNNPGVRTYLSYISPRFRVKVGDYRRRAEAEGMWREANSTYNPSMIVPDIITVTTME